MEPFWGLGGLLVPGESGFQRDGGIPGESDWDGLVWASSFWANQHEAPRWGAALFQEGGICLRDVMGHLGPVRVMGQGGRSWVGAHQLLLGHEANSSPCTRQQPALRE